MLAHRRNQVVIKFFLPPDRVSPIAPDELTIHTDVNAWFIPRRADCRLVDWATLVPRFTAASQQCAPDAYVLVPGQSEPPCPAAHILFSVLLDSNFGPAVNRG